VSLIRFGWLWALVSFSFALVAQTDSGLRVSVEPDSLVMEYGEEVAVPIVMENNGSVYSGSVEWIVDQSRLPTGLIFEDYGDTLYVTGEAKFIGRQCLSIGGSLPSGVTAYEEVCFNVPCSDGKVWDIETNQCVVSCSPGTYADKWDVCYRPQSCGRYYNWDKYEARCAVSRAEPLPRNPQPPRCGFGYRWDYRKFRCVRNYRPFPGPRIGQCSYGTRWDPVFRMCRSIPKRCGSGTRWDRRRHACIGKRPGPNVCGKGTVWSTSKRKCVTRIKRPRQCGSGKVWHPRVGRCVGKIHKRPGSKRPGMKRPGSKRPGMKRPGSKRPGMKRPGSKRPGMKRPGSKRPGMKRTGSKRPKASRRPSQKRSGRKSK